jgi:hypothetical protein
MIKPKSTVEKPAPKRFSHEYHQMIGAKGGAISGPKSRKNMTKEQARAIALKAVAARQKNPQILKKKDVIKILARLTQWKLDWHDRRTIRENTSKTEADFKRLNALTASIYKNSPEVIAHDFHVKVDTIRAINGNRIWKELPRDPAMELRIRGPRKA